MEEREKTELRAKIGNILVMHSAFEETLERIQACYDGALVYADPTCLIILGESRTGKSRAIEYFENKYPQYRDKDGLSTPILRMEVLAKPTVKGLVEELLYKIGDPIFDKGTEYSKTIRLRKLMSEAGTKMLILDEFQHFIDKGGEDIQHQVADWLKILVDKLKVGLVVAGLPHCINVIYSNDQLARRFNYPQKFKRFDWMVPEEQTEFRSILYSLQDSLAPLELPELDSEEMAFRMYMASGGIIGYVIKILREAISIAVNLNSLTIDLEILHKSQQRTILDKDKHVQAPFSKNFTLRPSMSLIADAMKIGVCEPLIPTKKPRKKKVNLGAILTAK